MTRRLEAAVFLDRDGTLINTNVVDGRPVPLHDSTAVKLLPGVEGGCRRLRDAGLALVMVTNQPDVARGSVSMDSVESLNQTLVASLGLDLALTCYHDDSDDCGCRKPKAGLLARGSRILGIELDRSSFMVGDRWRDVDAGRNAGVTTIFLLRGYDEALRSRPDYSTERFSDAVDWIIGSMHEGVK